MNTISRFRRWSTLALCTVLWLPVASVHAGKLYKWVDDAGQVRYGDRIPPQYAKKSNKTLNEQGIVVEIDDMPAVSGDRTRLVEVYQNLIENAIKFMGEQESPRIHIGSRQQDGKTCFFVSDNGIGIAAEFHDLVFELFERLSQDIEGTGVGLTLVKRIVEVHGGKNWVESDGLGRGCTILFNLPGPP